MLLRSTCVCAILVNATLFADQGVITGPIISPSTITFSSPDPDVTPTNASSLATIQWTMSGKRNGAWSLSVKALSPSLNGCPAVPVSAIQFQCTSWSASDGTGSCPSRSAPLSTGSQIVASGGQEGNPGMHTVTISFTFSDAWKYPASSSCSVQLIYTIDAQ